jgi:hypothetical protein
MSKKAVHIRYIRALYSVNKTIYQNNKPTSLCILYLSHQISPKYCDMTPKSRDGEVRANVHCQPTASPRTFSWQGIVYMDFHGYEPVRTFPWQRVHKQIYRNKRNRNHWIKCSVRGSRNVMKGEQFPRRKRDQRVNHLVKDWIGQQQGN